jgi:protein-L-isoaspartate(D-aspartate) O-methyltransferase
VATARELRGRLVDLLVDSGALTSPAVRRAFLDVPRERFVPAVAAAYGMERVYADDALVTRQRDGVPMSSSSQPQIMASMLEALDVRRGQRVLEIGLGTGYNAALLSRLAGAHGVVTSIDLDASAVVAAREALAATRHQVTAVDGDGRMGWAVGAPYDRIEVTASTSVIPLAWWEQLAPDGLLVVPLRLDAMQAVVVFARTESGFRSMATIPGGFMPLRDDADVPTDPTPTILVRATRPGRPPTRTIAYGPVLGRLSAAVHSAFVGHLAGRPRRRAVRRHPVFALSWQLALSSGARVVSVARDADPLRVGLVDSSTGAFAVFCAERTDTTWHTRWLETYGPADGVREELRAHVGDWTAAGSPSLDRLAVAVDYTDRRPRGPRALRTVDNGDHRIRFAWAATDP